MTEPSWLSPFQTHLSINIRNEWYLIKIVHPLICGQSLLQWMYEDVAERLQSGAREIPSQFNRLNISQILTF